MKVKNLIQQLSELPQELEIDFCSYDSDIPYIYLMKR